LRKLKYYPFFHNNHGLSYTVSAMLITGTTILLVLIASIYAYQILEQQKGLSEFEVAKKSMLSYNDALESVAWKLQASRSTRFTIEYGLLELTPNVYSIGINATVGGSTWQLSNTTFPGTNGRIRYTISDKYTSFGSSYTAYLLGNGSNVLIGSADNYGRVLVSQESSWVSVLLDERVRAMRTSVINVAGKDVNYVDIWVIKTKMIVGQPWSYIHDFDLKAKCLSIKTVSYGPYSVNNNPSAVISVRIGSTTSTGSVPLATTSQSQVVFNIVVSEIQVYV